MVTHHPIDTLEIDATIAAVREALAATAVVPIEAGAAG
jgi:hypothetical protein